MSENNTHDQLRRLIDEELLAGNHNGAYVFFERVVSRALNAGTPCDPKVLLEYWWDLARLGVIAIPGETRPGVLGPPLSSCCPPGVFLTDRGRRLLEQGEKSPHNPSKYLAAVRKRVSKPDEIALSFLSEAIEAWRCGLNRSSAVMLGCACERLVLGLAEALAAAGHEPWSSRVDAKLQKRVFISELFDDVREALVQLKGQKKLPRELGEAIDRKLSAIFDHARGLRNQSGHPTGEDIPAEEAEAGLLLFPGFCELVDKLVAQLGSGGI
jgi:hypothetical protein